jgi:hypothetical protein
VATFLLTDSYTHSVEMLRTRQEITSLLKKAEGNLKKIQEIHRELQSLMVYIESVLATKKPSSKTHVPQ